MIPIPSALVISSTMVQQSVLVSNLQVKGIMSVLSARKEVTLSMENAWNVKNARHAIWVVVRNATPTCISMTTQFVSAMTPIWKMSKEFVSVPMANLWPHTGIRAYLAQRIVGIADIIPRMNKTLSVSPVGLATSIDKILLQIIARARSVSRNWERFKCTVVRVTAKPVTNLVAFHAVNLLIDNLSMAAVCVRRAL